MMLVIGLAAATIAAPCRPPAGWRQLERSPAQFVVFGEQHGTQEGPALVGEIACSMAKRQSLLVGVELFSSANGAFQAAWRGSHASFSEQLERALPDWACCKGGPASRALFTMLVRLHALKSRGARIAVVAFTGARDPAQAERFATLPGQSKVEAMQAENLQQAARAGRYSHVLVLVGNIHARKAPWVRTTTSLEPMAMRLAATGRVMSLDLATSGGEAYNCQAKTDAPRAGPITQEMLDCAPHAYRPIKDVGGPPRIVIGGNAPDPAYDGVFYLGRITASLPVVP